MQQFTFKPLEPPSSLGFSVVICVEDADSDVMSQKGAMQRLSTAEPVFAVILAIAQAVQEVQAGTAEESVLHQWRKCLLTTTFASLSKWWRQGNPGSGARRIYDRA